MNKIIIKSLLLSILIIILITGNVFAIELQQNIPVIFNSINIEVNGQKVDADNLLYNGTTYVPLRRIAEILGKEVIWDSATNTARINDKSFLQSDDERESEIFQQPFLDLSTRSNPAGLNDVICMTSPVNDGNYFESEITLKEIIRGNKAWDKIVSANRFNTKPKGEYDVILARFSLKVTGASNENIQFDFNEYNFTLVSEDGKDYEHYSCVLPDPEISSKLYKGASHEGWVAFKVRTDDIKPLIVYDKAFDGTRGVWFKGYNEDGNVSLEIPSAVSFLPTSTTIDSSSELKSFLEDNFSQLETCIGTTGFTFNISENDRDYNPYDYWIKVGYEYEFFGGAIHSTKYTNKQKDKLKIELKEHMRNIGETVIKKMPDKKFYGGYYDSWYRYPNLRVDLQTRRYYSWTNYDEPNILSNKSEYEQTKPSKFRWYDFIDDEF